MGRGTVGQMGTTAVIQVGGIEIILTERRIQPYDAEVLRSVGIEPQARKLIALKSAVHSGQTIHRLHIRFWTWIPPAFTARTFSVMTTKS